MTDSKNLLNTCRILKTWYSTWYLWAGFTVLLLLLSLIRPLSHPDEGRYAEIGRWMLQSGDWLTPRLDSMPFFHKPPLLYWLEATFFALFGAHAWVARLTPVLHASLMLLAVYIAARRLGSAVLAKRAVVMLGSSLAFLAGGQYVNHDLMVATWISIAIGSFAMAFLTGDRPDRKLAWIGFAACGLGILSKGLIGIALPGMVLLIWLLWTRQLKKIIHLPWLSGLVIFGLIALPWFALAEQRFPGMLNYMFGMHHFQRFTGSSFNNNMPWWFYPLSLIVLFFPWVFFPFTGLYKKTHQTKPSRGEAGQTDDHTFSPAVISLCWIWIISIIGFFSFPTAKVIGYALPVIPPLVLLAAVGWHRTLGQSKRENQYFIALCLVNIAVALAITVAMGIDTHKKSASNIGKTYQCLAKPNDQLYILDGFPYDLPFTLNANKPIIVIQDWAMLRTLKSDNWRSELIDAADFDPNSAQILQSPAQLALASTQHGNWLLATATPERHDALSGWVKVKQGTNWSLYHSKPTTTVDIDNELSSSTFSKCLS
jgi:4-amino-4-deoxy-L-arabinose transferase-like glycosyltransferase